MPRRPSHPIKPWLSPDFYFAVLDVQQIIQPTGYKFVVTTDVPCRLYMRWSTNPPQYHTIPSYRRGVYMHGDRYICFTAYHDNEQEEPGEGITHTFLKLGWPSCETRYFYFWGTKGVHVMNSTSCVFEKHFLAPAPPPVTEYLPCWHNRWMYDRSGTWSIVRNGSDPLKHKDYQRPLSLLYVATSLNALYSIYRSYLNFNTKVGMPPAPVVQAEIGIYVTHIGAGAFDLMITKGLWREIVVASDWALQTPETTILGQLNTGAMILNQYNWIPLNAAGITWLNSSIAEHKQHESFDWQKSVYWPTHVNQRVSQSFTPQTTHDLTRIKVRIKKIGSGGGNTRCEIYVAGADHCPTGAYLARDTVHPDYVPGGVWGDWYEFSFLPTTLTAGVEYCIVLYNLGGNASNQAQWIGASGNEYPNGVLCYSSNGGVSWTPYAAYDNYFIEYEELEEGQTNFCLRTGSDVNDVEPGAGADFAVHFHSAQKGVGFYPILRLTC